MIIVRAPLRVSFVGGGTDLPDFYKNNTGRVISAAIDKYVYVTINRPPLVRNVSARYGITEQVNHPKELLNGRIREALIHQDILSGIDVGTFSDVPVKTGLGSSSSFSVALMKALLVFKGKNANRGEIAELASHLEINLLKEPIGKQDQYASAFGGLNIFQFNNDNTVDVTPVHLDFRKMSDLESHISVFFTGVTRLASSVLTEQKSNIVKKQDELKKMAESVFEFREQLLKGNFKRLGEILHDGWLTKKTLASNVSNPVIDELYSAGISAGAWGGKVLGAGGGGCLLFIASPENKNNIRIKLQEVAVKNKLNDFTLIPIKFVQSGVEVLMNQDSNIRQS